jgi:hypothetical protein
MSCHPLSWPKKYVRSMISPAESVTPRVMAWQPKSQRADENIRPGHLIQAELQTYCPLHLQYPSTAGRMKFSMIS